jgi:hypothetical protein
MTENRGHVRYTAIKDNDLPGKTAGIILYLSELSHLFSLRWDIRNQGYIWYCSELQTISVL